MSARDISPILVNVMSFLITFIIYSAAQVSAQAENRKMLNWDSAVPKLFYFSMQLAYTHTQ